ncbi:MAG: hypothetical protein M1820_002088 [Bogoriella megaspora]|nr:MAG: hypothetical protein M1820_002088 [Bogoriella megaspora]
MFVPTRASPISTPPQRATSLAEYLLTPLAFSVFDSFGTNGDRQVAVAIVGNGVVFGFIDQEFST